MRKPVSKGFGDHALAPPPAWALRRPKRLSQSIYDLVMAPLRMAVLPDQLSERLHATSLRAERFARVLPEIRGRCLDVGAGDNLLLRLYQTRSKNLGTDQEAANASIGVDVIDWGGGCTSIESSAELPFEDNSFDTVCYIACINHIPERREALIEARRVLRPGGRVLITMINRFLGVVGHAIWWYSEDKHREVDQDEEMGMNRQEVLALLHDARYRRIEVSTFFYGLSTLYIAWND